MIFIEIFKFLLIFFIGLIFLNYLRTFLNVSQTRTNIIYFYHTLFMFIRYFYSEYYIDDGASYYLWATTDNIYYNLTIKSHFYIVYFIRFLHLNFSFNYIHVCLVFSIIGSLGILFLVAILQNVLNRNYTNLDRVIILLFILMPSLNFFTSSIGKDTIIISSASIFLYSILNLKKRLPLLILSLFFIFMIRPYVGFFIFLSVIIFYIINFYRFSIFLNIFCLIFLVSLTIILPQTFLKEYEINYYNINFIIDYINNRQVQFQSSDTYYNIENIPFILRPFNYIFRPLFFEINNIFGIIISIENTFLIFLFVYYLFRINYKNIFFKKELQFIFIFTIVILVFLSNITGVMGVAIRQKWLVLMFLFYLFISLSNNLQKHKILQND